MQYFWRNKIKKEEYTFLHFIGFIIKVKLKDENLPEPVNSELLPVYITPGNILAKIARI